MLNPCPACGYRAVDNDRDEEAAGNCPSCGFMPEPGPESKASAAEWRRRWVERGMPWTSMAVPQPRDWDPTQHLKDPTRDDNER